MRKKYFIDDHLNKEIEGTWWTPLALGELRGHEQLWFCQCRCEIQKSVAPWSMMWLSVTGKPRSIKCSDCSQKEKTENQRVHSIVDWVGREATGTLWKVTGNWEERYSRNYIFWEVECKCTRITWMTPSDLFSSKRNACPSCAKLGAGRFDNGAGYIELRIQNSDLSYRYVLEHRHVMSEYLNRPLSPEETVHHKNGVKNDNRIENLELWASNHPSGQRVIDKIAYARYILSTYEHEEKLLTDLPVA